MSNIGSADSEDTSDLEAEILGRLLSIASSGAWIYTEHLGTMDGDDSVGLATLDVKGRDCIVLGSRPVEGLTADNALAECRVELGWLVDELDADVMLVLDPQDLPSVRLPVSEIQRLFTT